jgi:hypothetical protein
LQSNFLQRLLYLIELERLDDRLDFLHRVSVSRLRWRPGPRWNRDFVSRSRAKVRQGYERALDRVEVVQSATLNRVPLEALAVKLGNLHIIAPSTPQVPHATSVLIFSAGGSLTISGHYD